LILTFKKKNDKEEGIVNKINKSVEKWTRGRVWKEIGSLCQWSLL
jgi:hypothetical protein